MTTEQAVNELLQTAWEMHTDAPFPGVRIIRPKKENNAKTRQNNNRRRGDRDSLPHVQGVERGEVND